MVVSVAATGPGADAEPLSSTFFASRYVRDPLPRSVTCTLLASYWQFSSVPVVRRAEAGGWASSPWAASIITSTTTTRDDRSSVQPPPPPPRKPNAPTSGARGENQQGGRA
ncbi:unnamed protein product [Urochloa humidicola]